jgi:ABC-type sugar transport system ATPase subunit
MARGQVIRGTMDGGSMSDDTVPAYVTVYSTDDQVGNIPLGSEVVVMQLKDVENLLSLELLKHTAAASFLEEIING